MLKSTYVGDIMIRIFPELVVPLVQYNKVNIVKEQKYRKIEQSESISKNSNNNMTEQNKSKKKEDNMNFDGMLQEEIKKLI